MSNFHLDSANISYINLKDAIAMPCEQSMSGYIDAEVQHYQDAKQVVPDFLFSRVLIQNGKKVFAAHTHPRLIYKNIRTGELVCVVNVWYNQTPEDRLNSARVQMQYVQQNLTSSQAALSVVLERGQMFSQQIQDQAKKLVECSIFPSYAYWQGNKAAYDYFKAVQHTKWEVESRKGLYDKYVAIVKGLEQKEVFV
mgnify:CR=1 FL=1